MGTTQSRDKSEFSSRDETVITPTTASNNNSSDPIESDDEFTDCADELEKLSVDIRIDDESEKNSKPLEKIPQSVDDDVERSQANATIAERKHSESDDDDESVDERRERQRKEMEEFREEMNKKREMRHACINKLREELIDLREKLASEMDANAQLREILESQGANKTFDQLADENKRLKVELAECQLFLQTSNSENINKSMENRALRDQVRSLKEVVVAVKEMLNIRETQVDQMKAKLAEIESSMADREVAIMSKSLQEEYQRQLDNIQSMRDLYEERANLMAQEKENLMQQLEDKDQDMRAEVEKSKNLEEYIGTLENNLKQKNSDIAHLESEIGILKSEKSQVSSEMSAVNQLIAQVLLGFNANGSNIDIDKLINMLEQNRDLLNEMSIAEDYDGLGEGPFLPKLLYDIFLQANDGESTADSSKSEITPSTPEEIAEKLPKVWRVLIELLSHHKKLEIDEERVLDDCYKSVQTTSGTQNVLSVSKTFIKLKDLILEKRSLQKDTTRLKTLYSHLEVRLDKQEKKLSSVSLELTKTWHLVGKIKRQHRQLHTHEQILCYQLQQKRRKLNELKAELEYCRKKWAQARALNNDSEEQCRLIRQEFANRKIQDQNSAESGYSDEHPSDEDEAGNSPKIAKFDNNLELFDRTASPTYSERRHSTESPMIQDLDHLCLFSRAQSEPPRILIDEDAEGSTFRVNLMTETETYEVLDLIPDPLHERCAATQSEEPDQSDCNMVVTPPPEILVYSPPKLKAQLRRCKKTVKRRKSAKSNKETAEEMYFRLMGQNLSECNTCSSTTSIDEDDIDVENIEEIPLDEGSGVTMSEDCGVKLDAVTEEVVEIVPEPPKPVKTPPPPPQPSTSEPRDCFTAREHEYLDRREARLARLEAEAKAFCEKMAKNKNKGQQLEEHLNEVHQNFLDRQRERTKSEDEKTDASKDEPTTSSQAEKKEKDENSRNDDGENL